MDYLLLYILWEARTVLVLEAGTEREDSDAAENALEENGPNLDQWPEDLGAYDKSQTYPGLMVWEGTVPESEDEKWEGKLRKLNADEMRRVTMNLSPF